MDSINYHEEALKDLAAAVHLAIFCLSPHIENEETALTVEYLKEILKEHGFPHERD